MQYILYINGVICYLYINNVDVIKSLIQFCTQEVNCCNIYVELIKFCMKFKSFLISRIIKQLK